MSITEYNGGGVVAMTGKNCVAIASDRRFGVRQLTVSCDETKIFPVTDKLMLGMTGLQTDVLTVKNKLNFRTELYKLREERDISPHAFASSLSALLYEHRFGPYFVGPVIAGLNEKNEPYVASMDLIGATTVEKSFCVDGTCSDQLFGACESFWRPDLEPEELVETISQALMAAVDRDCLSGWGGTVHVITPTEVFTKTIKGRMD